MFILGDLTDRRDRHPGQLVNELVSALTYLTKQLRADVTIICGNHDRPLYDAKQPYWQFLSVIDNVHFVSKPRVANNNLLLLPYTDNPKEDWHGIDFSLYACAFAHIPTRQYAANPFLRTALPRRTYSGDEHTPSVLDNITYVGAPHPVRYGDTYNCRVLRLDDDYNTIEQVLLHPPRKHMIDIGDAAELEQVKVRHGDAAKVRLSLPLDQVGEWSAQQAQVAAWARQRGIELASVEPVVEVERGADYAQVDDPYEVLLQFAIAHDLDPELLKVGIELLEDNT